MGVSMVAICCIVPILSYVIVLERALVNKIHEQGTRLNEFILTTRLGNQIKTERTLLDKQQILLEAPITQQNESELDHYHKWEWRTRIKNHTHNYNCWGAVWASRRVGICCSADIKMILDDDKYRQLTAPKHCKVGDLVIWVREAKNTGKEELILEYAHVAWITNIDRDANKDLPTLILLSKWGWPAGEAFHRFDDTPTCLDDYRREYWTDRPKPADGAENDQINDPKLSPNPTSSSGILLGLNS